MKFLTTAVSYGLRTSFSSPNLAQNFGQIPSRALGLTIFSELHLEVVAPRFEEVQRRQRGGQQTLAFRYRRRSATELGYIPASISVIVELEQLGAAAPCVTLLHRRAPTDVKYTHQTIKNALYKNAPYSSQSIFEISNDRVLVKQSCDECSLTLGLYRRRYTKQQLGKESCTLIDP